MLLKKGKIFLKFAYPIPFCCLTMKYIAEMKRFFCDEFHWERRKVIDSFLTSDFYLKGKRIWCVLEVFVVLQKKPNK